MLVGSVLEKTGAEAAWQMCAGKLADRVRDKWLENTKSGLKKWEESFSEDPAAIPGLREEGFKDLVGVDYMFHWWGATDSEELAGEVDVMWKIATETEVFCYRTWVKLAERDFILGLYREERDKRSANREAFLGAFAQWKELFEKL